MERGMRAAGIVVCLLVCAWRCAADESEAIRLERNYDYDGVGESYYLKVYYDGSYRYVCYEEHWTEFDVTDPMVSRWCQEYYMKDGTPFGKPAEIADGISLELSCDDAMPDDCDVMKNETMTCGVGLQIQCLSEMSQFEAMAPLSWGLVAIIALLGLLLIISWIACCCIYSRK